MTGRTSKVEKIRTLKTQSERQKFKRLELWQTDQNVKSDLPKAFGLLNLT